jgi:hypothetical protein
MVNGEIVLTFSDEFYSADTFSHYENGGWVTNELGFESTGNTYDTVNL